MGFNPQDEKFSYDLGWLIQNDQISDSDLSRVLLDDYSQRLYLLARSLRQPPADSSLSVDKTLVNILANRHKYQNDISGRAWLYSSLIQKCLQPKRAEYSQRLQNIFQLDFLPRSHTADWMRSLDRLQMLVAFFQLALDLKPEEIAATAQIPLTQVETLSTNLQNQLRQHHQNCPTCIAEFSTRSNLEDAIRQEFHSIQIPPAAALRTPSIFSRATAEKKQRSLRARLFQAGQATLIIVAVLVIGWVAMHPARAAVTALAPSSAHRNALIPDKSTHPTDTPVPTPTLDPLLNPDVSYIVDLARGNQNEWHTLWLDVQVTRYNTSGGDNQPLAVTRTQAWINPPSQIRVIYGPASMGPIVTYAIVNQTVTGQNFQNSQTFQEEASGLITDPDLQRLLVPGDMFPAGGSFTRVGRAILSGKPCWVIDWTADGANKIRYWIDAQYGIIMRRQELGGDGFTSIITDTIVNSVAFDAKFPQTIFDLGYYHGDHFAYDFSGVPELTENQVSLASYVAPETNTSLQPQSDFPTKLSLARSSLEFEDHRVYEFLSHWVIYANRYLLGSLPVGGNALLSCQRSPDGAKIAYNFVAANKSGNTALYVGDLSAIESAHAVLPNGLTMGDYAFSPDSRRLAFYGCDKTSGFCGIFILDTLTNKLTRLMALNYADYMLWSPDGKQLAFVGREDSYAVMEQKSKQNMLMNEMIALSNTWHFYVIDARTGDLHYKRAFDWLSLNAPDDSPTQSWSTAFKPPSNGLTPCTSQPN